MTTLSLDNIDRINILTDRIASIADIIAGACVSIDKPADNSIPDACGMLMEMAEELKTIAHGGAAPTLLETPAD